MKLRFELSQTQIATLLTAFTKAASISGEDQCVLKFSDAPSFRAAFFPSDAPEVWLTFDKAVFTAALQSEDGAADPVPGDVDLSGFVCESARGNLIDLEIPVKSLVEALKFAAKMKKTVARLSRSPHNGEPVLVFDFRYSTEVASLGQHASHFSVNQLIPVLVLRSEAEIREMPQLVDPDVKTEIVSLSRLKHITERIKHLKIFPHTELSLNDDGALRVACTTDEAQVVADLAALDSHTQAAMTAVNMHTGHFLKIIDALYSLPTAGPPIFAAKGNQYLCVWAPLSDHVGALTCVAPAIYAGGMN